jgi:hypothetical protein
MVSELAERLTPIAGVVDVGGGDELPPPQEERNAREQTIRAEKRREDFDIVDTPTRVAPAPVVSEMVYAGPTQG